MTSGDSAGSRTNTASSGMPNLVGSDQNGRPRKPFSSPNPAISAASAFTQVGQLSDVAPSISARKTSTSKGVARVKMSCVGEKFSMNSGSPARRNRCSYRASSALVPMPANSSVPSAPAGNTSGEPRVFLSKGNELR